MESTEGRDEHNQVLPRQLPAAACTGHTAALHPELHLHSPTENHCHTYVSAGGEKIAKQREKRLDEIF